MISYESWGKLYQFSQQVQKMQWRFESLPKKLPKNQTLLPYGKGRSYGDSCLNENGTLIDTGSLNHLIQFDPDSKLLTCEAGVSLEEVLNFLVPKGFFLPTTPGTKFITVGGAIANDIHGKNHHFAGTFGNHVTQFELLRSDGTRLICSPSENTSFYNATIGGLGLTGIITWAQFKVIPIPSAYLEVENIRFHTLEEFFKLAKDSEAHFENTVAWIDCLAKGRTLGRGLFMRGNFVPVNKKEPFLKTPAQLKMIPFNAPNFLLNSLTIRCFNILYYFRQIPKIKADLIHYEPFFYPLDSILHWNRIYGKRGFFQYQSVIPLEYGLEATRKMLQAISNAKKGSFLAVLKTFGSVASPGMLSFPKEGVTLALDFPNEGKSTLELFDKLDQLVLKYEGSIYPAKDARMSAAHFQHFYPQWKDFQSYVDPSFSSSFWRRVTTV